jgi:catechol 2,3-dioxygenase-like lactoylglutathione lyase family enzyme
MTIGIHHVQISIAPEQLERSRDFYIDLLGMPQIHDPFGIQGFWLAAGDQQVHVRVEANIDRHRTNAHPAFLVKDLAATRAKLDREGYTIHDQPKLEGFDRLHVIDPSGNRIELMQRE